jgi:hypothetical protein
MLYLFCFSAIVLTISGYIARKAVLATMGGLFWLLNGIYSYTLSTKNWDAWDIYLGLAFGCLFFTIISVFSSVAMREKKEDLEQTIMPESEFIRFNNEMAEMNSQLHIMGGGYRPAPANENISSESLQKYIDKERNKTLKEYRGGI